MNFCPHCKNPTITFGVKVSSYLKDHFICSSCGTKLEIKLGFLPELGISMLFNFFFIGSVLIGLSFASWFVFWLCIIVSGAICCILGIYGTKTKKVVE